MSEAWVMRDETFRVLGSGESNRVRTRDICVPSSIMKQTHITELGEFSRIGHYLAGQGLVAERVNGCELFELTLEGIAVGTRY